MKILSPVTRYKCGFCKRIYIIKQACIDHEDKCYKNPDRNCHTCHNEGIEFFDTLGPGLGVIPDGEERPCSSCIIAEFHGGKSYRSEELQAEYKLQLQKERQDY